MSNKEKILESARQLFNEKGSHVVSTNHIANELKISPGNLYYHYKNKEAIILAIFEQMVLEWDSSKPTSRSSEIPSIEEQLALVFRTVWKYRFIHRELSPLVQNYPSIKTFCTPVLRQRVQEIHGIVDLLEKQSILIPLDQETKAFLGDALLMIPLFWQSYLDVIGESSTKANVERGVDMMKQLLHPYLA